MDEEAGDSIAVDDLPMAALQFANWVESQVRAGDASVSELWREMETWGVQQG